jgi:hypothetical protein
MREPNAAHLGRTRTDWRAARESPSGGGVFAFHTKIRPPDESYFRSFRRFNCSSFTSALCNPSRAFSSSYIAVWQSRCHLLSRMTYSRRAPPSANSHNTVSGSPEADPRNAGGRGAAGSKKAGHHAKASRKNESANRGFGKCGAACSPPVRLVRKLGSATLATTE